MIDILLVLLLGLFAGKLINYLSDVLPSRRKLAAPYCTSCEMSFVSLPALAGYAFWPFRCASCGQSQGWRPWLVDLAAMGGTLWLWMQQSSGLAFSMGWVLLIFFGVVVVIDMEHRLILHVVSLTGALIGLGVGFWLHGWQSTLLGGLAGFGCMLGLYILGIVLVRLVGRWQGSADGEAMGFGDVMLGGVIGLLLGWPGILAGLFLTIVLSGIISLVFILLKLFARRYRPDEAIPYGPFLVASAFILLFVI